jgi:hypothetical protein
MTRFWVLAILAVLMGVVLALIASGQEAPVTGATARLSPTAMQVVLAEVGQPFAVSADLFDIRNPSYEINVIRADIGLTVLKYTFDPVHAGDQSELPLERGDLVELAGILHSPDGGSPVFLLLFSEPARLLLQFDVTGQVRNNSGEWVRGSVSTPLSVIEVVPGLDGLGDWMPIDGGGSQ